MAIPTKDISFMRDKYFCESKYKVKVLSRPLATKQEPCHGAGAIASNRTGHRL